MAFTVGKFILSVDCHGRFVRLDSEQEVNISSKVREKVLSTELTRFVHT